MSKSKSILLAGCLLLATGLSASPMAGAQDLRVDEVFPAALAAEDMPSVVIHKGVVLGSGPQGLFSHDIATGEVTVRTREGARFDYRLEPGALPKQFPDLVWVGAEQTDDAGPRAKTACSSQAATLSAAIAGVQAACGGSGSGSATCGAALAFYQSAQSDYAICIRQHLK